MFGRAKGKDLILDKDCLAHEDTVFLLEHGFDASLLYKERSKRMSNLKMRYDDAVRSAGALEDRIRALEAENTELRARAAASRHDGAAVADALSAQLADKNRKLSEAKADLQSKVLELSRQTQDLRQKLAENGGSKMDNDITQWEYKEVKMPKNPSGFESGSFGIETLNQLGKEGWEDTGNTASLNGYTSTILMKRPVTKSRDDGYGYGR